MFSIVMMCPAAIWAQDIKPIDIKPGLWENTTTSEMSGMSMPAMPAISEDQLAKMPPAQRAQVEAMMKGGMGAPRTTTTKACITKEQLTRSIFDNGDKSCSYKLTNSSSSNQMVHVECTRGTTKTAGDLNLDRVDSEHVKGNMLMKTTDSAAAAGRGQNMNIKISFTNKWLGADCGDVKPSGDK
jgi:hypothetical protein